MHLSSFKTLENLKNILLVDSTQSSPNFKAKTLLKMKLNLSVW